MWKDLLKSFGKQFLKNKTSGQDAKGSAKNAGKSVAKKQVKNVVAKKAKGKILKIILMALFPWGLLLIIVMVIVSSLAIFFTEGSSKVLSSKDVAYIQEYAGQHQNDGIPSDVQCSGNYDPSAQIVENYIKFLVMQKHIATPVDYNTVVKLTKQAFKDLKPVITTKDAVETIKTTKTTVSTLKKGGLKETNTTSNTQKINIKIIETVNSVYGAYKYTYKTESTSQTVVVNGVTTTTVTTEPQVVNSVRTDDFGLLTALLKKQGLMYSDMQVAIGAILYSTDSLDSWDWINKNKLPAPQQVSIDNSSSYYGGSVAGIPAKYASYEPYFMGAGSATGIPPWLLVADVAPESGWDKNSISKTGAVGLLQFEPYDFDSNCTQYGMINYLHANGFSGSIAQLKKELYTNAKLQIYVGAWEWRYYFDWTVHSMGLAPTYGFESSSNMKYVPWNAKKGTKEYNQLEWIIKETALIYNKGQGSYGENPMNYAYSCEVFDGAMKIRANSKLIVGQNPQIPKSASAIVKKVIEAGEACIGNSKYVYDTGRTMEQQKEHTFDCSSFVWHCYYFGAGIKLGPLSSVSTTELIQDGIVRKVPASQRQAGDLIFFSLSGPNDHVGIYLGNNKFINDECHGAVRIDNINSYWGSHIYSYGVPVALANAEQSGN